MVLCPVFLGHTPVHYTNYDVMLSTETSTFNLDTFEYTLRPRYKVTNGITQYSIPTGSALNSRDPRVSGISEDPFALLTGAHVNQPLPIENRVHVTTRGWPDRL